MINRVVLVGRMTKDADLKYTSTGTPVANFTLAVNRTFSNQQGEKEVDFINCVVWKKPAENLANYTKKGSLIGLEGRIQVRNYDGQDGKKVYVTEVVADSVQFLDSREKTGNPIIPSNPHLKSKDDPFSGNGKTIDITDDSLPF